jgi:uncharacterized DUF497 family protein
MSDFEWDPAKNRINRSKHGVGFEFAQRAFLDPWRVIAEDVDHSDHEQRLFLFRQGRRRHHDGAIHVAERQDQDIRGRLLAKRESDL